MGTHEDGHKRMKLVALDHRVHKRRENNEPHVGTALE
jgi:hypothetical protein